MLYCLTKPPTLAISATPSAFAIPYRIRQSCSERVSASVWFFAHELPLDRPDPCRDLRAIARALLECVPEDGPRRRRHAACGERLAQGALRQPLAPRPRLDEERGDDLRRGDGALDVNSAVGRSPLAPFEARARGRTGFGDLSQNREREADFCHRNTDPDIQAKNPPPASSTHENDPDTFGGMTGLSVK